MNMDLKSEVITAKMLLQYYVQIMDELRARKIVRTSNNPIGDYTEWLVAERLDLKLVPNSTTGYDAIDSFDTKFQIKGRRITPRNPSRQLSAIRNLNNHDFDYLIAVLFNAQFDITSVMKIPHAIIGKYARFREHVNAHILILRGGILDDPLVEDLTSQFSK
jgi:hypothetical protein